ncbi:hypothetical protein [Escherichia coli]|uniref:hypothetical protein n=1 Tax=Escherichia coli TaxID=562 RepID=UPI0019D1CF09|nr:hypothetical protein [Escherichia coli]MBN6225046.1 hypothetical protein [Escherichia coli]MBN6285205.1 hypothetical protein [Escherichia coli]
MSRLSQQSQHNAVVVCKELSSLNARGLPGGEDDVSSYLSPRRKRSFLTVASIGWAPVALFSVAVRACVLPCVIEKVLMVNPAANAESVGRFVAW